jgi:hypothetical protein
MGVDVGFFDQIIKDIASGDIDKKLMKLADSIENISGKLDDSVDKLAKQPEKLSKQASEIGVRTGKVMDIVKE